MRSLVVACVLAGCGRVEFAQGVFCGDLQPQPLLCSDFDGADPWSDSIEDHGALAVIASTDSLPYALAATTDDIPAMQPATADRRAVDLGTTQRATIAFDMRVDTIGQSDPVVAVLTFDDGATYHAVNYVYREPPRVAYIEDTSQPHSGTTMYRSYPFQSASVGAWHRIAMTIDVGANVLHSTTDGATTLDAQPTFTTSGNLSASLGVVYLNGPSSPWRIVFDNIVVTLD